MTLPPANPLRYAPELDPIEHDEMETAEAISQTMTGISDRTFADGRRAIRPVHAKSHGLLKTRLEVLPDLPPVLAQGLFARPHTYDAVMRLSTVPGDILDDSVSTPRGLALKVLGVEGDRLEGSEDARTQDFIMVNGRLFNAPNGKAFLGNLKLLSATTDRVEGVKKAVSFVLRNVEKLVETFGGQSAVTKALGAEPPNHILGETFFAQLPVRFGDYMAKLQIVPVSPELTALTDQPVEIGEDADILRTKVIEHFESKGGVWELRAQLCTDLTDMPIDDPTKDWDENLSPFITVARLTAEPQIAWSQARSIAVDDAMGFSVWRGLQAHRPLGPLMRMRKLVYERSHRFRSERNRTPVREPETIDAVPDH